MKRVYTKDISVHIGKKITIAGFVQTLRVQSKIVFLILRDVTGTVQTVVEISSPVFETAKNLSHESVVKITGIVKGTPQAPNGVEVGVTSIEVLSTADSELPIPVITKGGEETEAPIRYDFRWIDLRKPEKKRIFEVWTEFEKGWRKYWDKNDFIQLYPPNFLETQSESGAEVFTVNYFDRKAFLPQSPQFYKQMAMAAGMEKVFMVSPVFRAEESFTTRHVTEFTGWDFEISYIESLTDIMDAEEGMIIEGFKAILEKFPDINITIPSQPFPRITMAEAKKILAKIDTPSPEEYDLSPEEERAISEYVKKEHNHDFVFITEYHKSKSAFYHMRLEEGSDYSRRADLLYRGLEVTTLAQREHRVEILEKQVKEKGMALESLRDYLNFFRYGCPPHGGAGVGPGRFIMKMLDLSNIREATYLPRDVKRLNP
ncbi:MAG: aspartate--tRNA(Asn) ligase [Candidatus Zambryskibacteria bacterium]|nr:aspartate--tRNA(Asn) ligase [Candidatus Zambryskibacteria bacterium]